MREALKANENDHLARKKLIDVLYRRMDYTIHEAPHHGVLMAQIDEDIKIANELECLTRASGEEERYAGFIFLFLFRYYTTTWNDYMKRRADFTSFNDFLNRAAPFIPLTAAMRPTRE